MVSVDDLLKINGVAGAFEFTSDGKLVACKAKADVPAELAEMSAEFCAAVTLLFNTAADPFAGFKRPEGPALEGRGTDETGWLVVTGHNRGVFAEGEGANVDELIGAVLGTKEGFTIP